MLLSYEISNEKIDVNSSMRYRKFNGEPRRQDYKRIKKGHKSQGKNEVSKMNMRRPHEESIRDHWRSAPRVHRYLNGTQQEGIIYPSQHESENNLEVYGDSEYGVQHTMYQRTLITKHRCAWCI